ncbi:MAG TPA: Kae1-associated serine/threonine protein kinase [Candidatus Pacearchaeota archaeon]|nr:Kae1-associated serine/threonine protein kinase [Candidatus Pacearchaeota archaeon]
MKPILIQQGAEAKIFLNKNEVTKDRTPKLYRHPKLDKQIRTRRTRSEAKILAKAKSIGVNVPKILKPNTKYSMPQPNQQNMRGYQIPNTDKFKINLEFIPGDRLSQTLNSYPEKKQLSTMQKLGHQVAKLHANSIIHADLTTSNVILYRPTSEATHKRSDPQAKRPTSEATYLIDFGLSYISTKTEDKTVDLHLMKQALEAKHFQNAKKLFIAFKKGYQWKDSKKILERLIIVEKRGRYKH